MVFDPSAFAKKGTKSVGVGAAVVRSARQGRELPSGHLHGLRSRKEHALVILASVSSQRMDERPWRCKVAGVPKGSSSARGTSWLWRCSTSTVRCCRTPGSRATTRWAGPRNFARNCGPEANGTCWPCPRTRWSATSTRRRRNTPGTGSIPKTRSMRRGSLVQRSARVRLDEDRGSGRREGAANGRRREVSRASANAHMWNGPGGSTVHHAE